MATQIWKDISEQSQWNEKRKFIIIERQGYQEVIIMNFKTPEEESFEIHNINTVTDLEGEQTWHNHVWDFNLPFSEMNRSNQEKN